MNYILKEKLDELKSKLKRLEIGGRKEIARRLEEAKKLGDLSENSEYTTAREDQERNERKIIELDNIIKNALIITTPISTNSIGIGSSVDVSIDGKKEVFWIVGSQDSNPTQGEVSNQSPIGVALLGHKAGDVIEVKIPRGIKVIKILKIN
ncbi:transcription elongation factor GreA [Candidatus Azambacteria bacterium]|nr:transcription elongation factor GreA [Candidatus Azambacteria bacterium]